MPSVVTMKSRSGCAAKAFAAEFFMSSTTTGKLMLRSFVQVPATSCRSANVLGCVMSTCLAGRQPSDGCASRM